MSVYLLDTNHAAELLKSRRSPLWEKLYPLAKDDCLLCRPVVAELWFMVFNSQRVDENRSRLEQFLSQFTIAEFDEPAAIEYGRLRTELRGLGTPIPTFDVLIASIARVRQLVVVSSDKHFRNVPGLQTVDWLARA